MRSASRLGASRPLSVLTARDLSVRRGRTTVLSRVSLDISGGTVVHLGGANGSGKTSLLRVLSGLSRPSSGTLERPPTTAFVPERVSMISALACGEWLRAMRRLRRLAPIDWGDVLETCGLDRAVLDRQTSRLSKGMLQRIAIVEALRSETALLLLDEPFSGLDTDGRSWLGAQLAGARAPSGSVLFTDHSGAAESWIEVDARLLIDGGTCTPVAATTQAERDGTVQIRAVKPDGETLVRRVPEATSDALLRDLLDDDWHIEAIDR
jgi:ABC-type multidrug transport system ATPase subunit